MTLDIFVDPEGYEKAVQASEARRADERKFVEEGDDLGEPDF
jgi:hypothetical protein